MSRPHRIYGERTTPTRRFAGLDVTTPRAGHFRMRLRAGAVKSAIRVWHGPPHDPVTGEELDRSWRWQATADGDLIDFDRAWPACAADPISEIQYRHMLRRIEWAKQRAPDSAFANIGQRYDPLDSNNPLPF